MVVSRKTWHWAGLASFALAVILAFASIAASYDGRFGVALFTALFAIIFVGVGLFSFYLEGKYRVRQQTGENKVGNNTENKNK